MNCTICVAKTKALISCAVIVQLIKAFGFANAECWFSDVALSWFDYGIVLLFYEIGLQLLLRVNCDRAN